MGTPPADELHHFVIDTSRNGRGAWTPPQGKYNGDPETWCNAPGRGLGPRPTADTGGTIDPEYGIVDPPAGAWWTDQAHALARNAVPRLTFNR
ncbi:glycoside hydrolase family 6 protein [Streptomyces sp. CA-142005]|uniref:glycoside hydrolase family 6 protein n=1 Tax=Streptomyces sp. CA-142005 TaxID=3240052 RepID=UPI003D92589A